MASRRVARVLLPVVSSHGGRAGRRLDADLGDLRVGGTELLAGVDAAVLAPQPLAGRRGARANSGRSRRDRAARSLLDIGARRSRHRSASALERASIAEREVGCRLLGRLRRTGSSVSWAISASPARRRLDRARASADMETHGSKVFAWLGPPTRPPLSARPLYRIAASHCARPLLKPCPAAALADPARDQCRWPRGSLPCSARASQGCRGRDWATGCAATLSLSR